MFALQWDEYATAHVLDVKTTILVYSEEKVLMELSNRYQYLSAIHELLFKRFGDIRCGTGDEYPVIRSVFGKPKGAIGEEHGDHIVKTGHPQVMLCLFGQGRYPFNSVYMASWRDNVSHHCCVVTGPATYL